MSMIQIRPSDGGYSVLVDGKDIARDVTALTLTLDPNGSTWPSASVTLTMRAVVDVESGAEVVAL